MKPEPVNPLLGGNPSDVLNNALYVLEFLEDAVNRRSMTVRECDSSAGALFGHWHVLRMVIEALRHLGETEN